MTNAEKYLKDNVSVEEMTENILKMYNEWRMRDMTFESCIKEWFNKPITPTLTEDERVILRNLNKEEFTHIGRHKLGDLFLKYKAGTILNEYNFEAYTSIFQFIKERRRI